jgi:hypothetical protein
MCFHSTGTVVLSLLIPCVSMQIIISIVKRFPSTCVLPLLVLSALIVLEVVGLTYFRNKLEDAHAVGRLHGYGLFPGHQKCCTPVDYAAFLPVPIQAPAVA